MMRKLCTHFLLVLFIAAPILSKSADSDQLLVSSGDPAFQKVEAKKGDGIYSLLRRYKLNNGSCNMNKFLELNKLGPNESLVQGNNYFIPVMVFDYNGNSIRSTIGDTDMEKALRIKSYNEYLHAQNLMNASYTVSKSLWVPYHEINCTDISLVKDPEKTENTKGNADSKLSRYVPLFGDSYASVPIEDESLKNRVFYLVAGHGGPDPGAQCTIGSNTLCEDEYAYDVTLRLARNLMQHSAIVHVIVQDPNDGIRDAKYLDCDKDETTINKKQLPLNQKKRLQQRTDDINRLYANHKRQGVLSQTVISIHVDSRSQSKRQDVYFYHLKGSKSGKKIANNLQKTFEKKYQIFQKGRGYKGTVKDRGLYILRNTHPTAVFVELANIRNTSDHKRLLLNTNRQALANWLFEGLITSL
jgi:N-acetylmuramoyl-L-alanine amidase